MRYCCKQCFSFDWLRDYIQQNSTSGIGDCDYCGETSTPLIAVADLCDLFINLMEIYCPSNDPHGEVLINLIQEDYQVFSDDIFDSDKAARLLRDIFVPCGDDDSGESPVNPHELYYRKEDMWYHTTMGTAWDEFCEKVKIDSQSEPIFPDFFDEEFARLEAILTEGSVLFRAQIGFDVVEDANIKPFCEERMGPPPPEKAKAARANCDGQPVLYTADQESTAISEVKPYRGIIVSVAVFRVNADLRLVDLCKALTPHNPFIDEVPPYERELEHLFAAFRWELGRPLRRNDDISDYIPCQKLVNRIRDSGYYHGIRYPSAMRPKGSNVVLFDHRLTSFVSAKLVQVDEINISYGPMDEDS